MVAAILATLLILAPAASAATSVSYPENGEDPVATFSATDQDGDAIVWSLNGDDAARFAIDGGVLSFKSSPNYESPNSKSVGTLANRNVYNVTVQATGGSEDVVVTVTNVDEGGSVSFIGQGRFQPQVGRGLEATLSDPDKGPLNTFPTDEVWQWARSSDGTTWTDIEGATAAKRSPVAADDGHYLRASVTYTDEFASGKMVQGMTANKVEERTLANAAPSFGDQDDDTAASGTQVNRSMDENTAVGVNIGRPVSASDGDGDLLIYTLEDSPDLEDSANKARFTIDRASGQIKAGKKLDFETAEDEDSDTAFPATATDPDPSYPWLNDTADGATAFTDAASNVYILLVKATDPSGAGTTQAVAVTVSDINEAPAFVAGDDTPKVLNVVENTDDLRTGADGTTALGETAYNADDEDATQTLTGSPTDADTEANASLDVEGADKKYFTIEDTGVLAFVEDDPDTDDTDEDHEPDFEKKSSYSITVVATSGTGNRLLKTRLDVTVHVIDAEDKGKVSLTAREPQAGRTVVASLSDPDGGVILSRWTWATSDDAVATGTCADASIAPTAWTNVSPDVSSGAYTPKTEDEGKCLRAAATYTDDITDPADPAAFDDLTDVDGVQVVKVSEYPVQLSKADNTAPKFGDQDLTTTGDQSDETTRSVVENMADENVGGPINASDEDGDAMMFTLSGDDAASFKTDDNGQITTKVKLDYETKDTYVVALTASDPSGASDSIMVTITVTDGPDEAEIALNAPPAFAEDMAERMVEENMPAGTDVGDPVTASDADGDTLTYELSGDDNFAIDPETAQITTTASLDYDVMASHMVTVTADDGRGSTDSIDVTITVIPSNTPPAFTATTATRSVEENLDAGAPVGDPVTAMDNDVGDTVTYSLEGSGYFTIDMATGQINTTMMLDHEAMSTHSVTVTATDEDGETDTVVVTINVDNAHTGCDTAGNHGLVNDCEALLDSEDALGGSLNWTDDTAMSDWDGVTISDGRVTAIDLRDEGLDGTIPGALGRLGALTSLNLRSNADLSGEIPGSLGNLSNLTVLNLHSNSHTGGIPDLSGTSLVELYLPGNDLTGSVPAWLNGMTDMTELWLWGNSLSGALPDLSGMMSLNKLKLNGNTALTGIDAAMLPGGLRWLIAGQTDVGATAPDLSGTSLTTLWLNETGLSGAIPVANIPTSVTSLNLKDNSLSGTIPDMSGLTNLRYLRLHRNDLSGDIPGTLGDLESIERIWAYDNDLTGISAGLDNASDTLTHLYLNGNSFAEGTCLPGGLADVANNDFEMAGLAACGDGS